MKEFFKTLFQTSNDRIKNPFIGSFIMSWIIFNWESILTIIFSEKNIENRIDFVITNFYSLSKSIWFPLALALFYVIVLPYLMLFIDFLVLRAKKGRKSNLVKDKVSDLKDRQLIAIEESKLENIKASYAELSELNKQIDNIKIENENNLNEIKNLRIELNKALKEKKNLEQYVSLEDPDKLEYTKDQIKELDEEYEGFMKTNVSTYFEEIGTEISQFKSLPKGTDVVVLEKLLNKGLIKRIDDDANQRTYYILTKKGKHFWQKYILSVRIMSKEERDNLANHDDLPF